MKKTIRAILNGKKAGNPELRDAIMKMREKGIDVQVRVTWESQDMPRLVKEAVDEGIERIVVAGGDGTVNEAASAIIQIDKEKRPELAIIPLGTANDFATAIQVPNSIKRLYLLLLRGSPLWSIASKRTIAALLTWQQQGLVQKLQQKRLLNSKTFLAAELTR